ncbi:MAG: isoprenylcysteine carboxylmethyltransferase family protein [Bacteroidetes bacterium]|nr:isoprenylcysteine carboxylmethyltransferase family protein [Bacteroidota bacterium]
MDRKKKIVSLSMIIFTLIYILIFPAVLLFLSGDWFWTEGWIFSIWFLVLCWTTIIYLYRKDPELLNERYKKPGEGNQKSWDKYVVFGLMIGFVSWIVLMPLDAKRFGWSGSFPFFLKPVGGAGLLLSSFFFFRSYTDNTFLSALVRVQTERKHRLVTTGVYAFVRHPMYLGGILLFIGTPLLLGSFVGIALGLLVTLLLAFRTVGEEKMLQDEFEGYSEYKRKVKYRFIPYIW